VEPAVLVELTAPDGVTVGAVEWRVDERTVQRTLLDGVLLLPPTAAEPLRLNSSAAEIWSAIPTWPTADRLAAALAERHAVEPGAMRAAIDDILDELRAMGAIRAAGTLS
jgi:hypothetical protein